VRIDIIAFDLCWARTSSQVSRELINDLEGVEREIGILYEAIEKGDVGGDGWTKEVDLMPLLFRFVLDNATEFLFGETIGAQKALMSGDFVTKANEKENIAKLASGEEFAEAFDTCSYYMVLRIRLQQFAFLGTSRAFKKACKTVRSVPEYYVRRALVIDRAKKAGKFDLLSSLVDQNKDTATVQDQALGILYV
jgi:hypothetical protein